MIVDLKMDGALTRLTYDEFERLVRDGQLPPDAEIRFEAATGDRFVPLRTLELYRDLVDSDQMVFRRGLKERGLPLVTAILVGVQFRIYLWSKLPGGDSWLLERFANWAPAALETGQVHRLFSYGFLHLGLTHLAFNILFLAYTGWNLERALGRLNLLLVYLTSVFAGGLLSMCMSPDRPSLGASGGDFGLIAASVVFGWKYGVLIPKSVRKYYGWAILFYLVAALWSGFNSPGIDNWGHLGGLLGGAAAITLLHPAALTRYQGQTRRARLALLGVMGFTSLAMAATGPWLVPLEPWNHRGLEAVRPSYWVEGWTFTGDRGSFSPTQQSILVINTTVHAKPVQLRTAAQRFMEQVDAGGKNAHQLASSWSSFQGWPSVRLRVGFSLSSQPHELEALLVARGHYLHRVHLHTTASYAGRYRHLWERIVSRVSLTDPQELSSAQRKAEHHRTSWKAQADWAEALGRAGHNKQASLAWQDAMALNPRHPRPVAGWLQLLADYGMEGRLEAMKRSRQRFPDSPSVLIASALVMESLDQPALARTILRDGWRRLPGDRDLLQAIEERGWEPPQERPDEP